MYIINRQTLKENINYFEFLEAAGDSGFFILFDKELGFTSFDLVARTRKALKIKKVGHAGTLDPLATGVLLIAVGRGATKQIDTLQAEEKTYHTTIKIGSTTPSFDRETVEENQKDYSQVTENQIQDAIHSFIGEISQFPPVYSAKKHLGTRMYKFARNQEEIEIKPSIITIFEISNIEITLPIISFDVKCSKGTYIRSLASDIGAKLGVGAFLYDLRRSKSGEFDVNDAITVQEFERYLNPFLNNEIREHENFQRFQRNRL